MIDPNPDNRFPYRLHDAIRSAIRSADHQVAGGWAERDWESASTRAVAAARLLHDQAKEAGYTRDVLDLLGVAISLVCDQNTLLEKSMSVNYQDWLSQAVVFAPSVQGLRARIPTSSTTAYGQHIIDFVVGKSTDTPFQDRLRILRAIFDSDHPLRFAAGRHLGYALKAQHRWDEALDVFDELATLAPTDVNIGQRPLTLALARRFHDAISAAQGTPREAIIQRVTDYAHGFDQRYFDEIPQVMSKLRARGRQREYLDEEGDYLARRAFFRGPSLTEEEIELFRDEAEQSGNVYALRCALQAAVIWRTGDAADRGIALQQLKTLDKTASARGTIGFRYAFTEACDALMTGDWLSRLERLRSEIEQVDFRTRSWIPVECFLRTVGISLPPTTTQWIHAEDVVRERWRTHLSAYLARHGRTLPGEGAGL